MTAPEPGDLVLTIDQARAIDAAAIEEFGIPGILLMEHAALGVVAVIETLIDLATAPAVVIACGAGNNGGDGWAIARLLHERGAAVTVVPLGEPRSGSDAAINATIARRLGIAARAADESWGTPDLMVDALFGTGLDRPLTGAAAALVERINGVACPVVAVDVPSGVHAETGDVLGVAVRATATVTFVAPKRGFFAPDAGRWLGTVHVASIGAPRVLVDRFR